MKHITELNVKSLAWNKGKYHLKGEQGAWRLDKHNEPSHDTNFLEFKTLREVVEFLENEGTQSKVL